MTGAPTLVTDRLVLRELRASDAAAVASGAGDHRVARHLIAIPSPYPIALAKRWVVTRIGWWSAGRGMTLAITERSAPDALLGTVSLRRYARDRRAELGYWLQVASWGHGLASEATRAVVDFGFRELGLLRVYAQVIAGNHASMNVLDKIGMIGEGVKRQHIRKGDTNHDVMLYGLLRDEWARP